MEINWFGQAAFLVRAEKLCIYIDPYRLPDSLPKADFIFITHPHFDHLSPDDINKVIQRSTILIIPKESANQLGAITNRIISALPGIDYKETGLDFLTVPAYNIDKIFHPKKNNWVGYIIKFPGGKSFFHTGDSDNIPEYQKLKYLKITTMAAACGGTYTMNPEEAAQAALAVGPEELIPMHWGGQLEKKDRVLKIKTLLDNTSIVVSL